MMNFFEKVFRALNKERVKYLVAGGVAVNLYGYLRFTGDLDILALLDGSNLKKIDRVMKKLGYGERLPVSVLELRDEKKVQQWIKEKNLKAYTYFPPKNNPLQIDVLVEESLQFKKMAKGKVVKYISKVRIPVISLQDLVDMKKRANRAKDLEDLRSLLQLKGL